MHPDEDYNQCEKSEEKLQEGEVNYRTPNNWKVNKKRKLQEKKKSELAVKAAAACLNERKRIAESDESQSQETPCSQGERRRIPPLRINLTATTMRRQRQLENKYSTVLSLLRV